MAQSVYLFLPVTFQLLSAIFFSRLPLDGDTVFILLRRITRIKEHKEHAEKASASRPYTRSNRKTSKQEMHKSAITDYVTQQNYIVDRDSDWRTRGIKEAIWIKNKTKTA